VPSNLALALAPAPAILAPTTPAPLAGNVSTRLENVISQL
jgi:hypothetical protein